MGPERRPELEERAPTLATLRDRKSRHLVQNFPEKEEASESKPIPIVAITGLSDSPVAVSGLTSR